MQHINVTEAAAHLPRLVEAALKGEEVILTGENEPLVRLAPVIMGEYRRQPGSAKGMMILSEDFDAPLDDFREYQE